MKKRALVVLFLGLSTAVVWAGVGTLSATGAKKKPRKQFTSYAAPAFTPVDESTHNNMGDTVCADFKGRPAANGEFADENNADLNAVPGSYLHSVQLPHKATVNHLRLYVNDNDGDDDAFVFLVRKQIEPNLSPAASGYEVMAETRSEGAENNVLRAFTDGSVDGQVINNRRYYYMLELVNCAIVEPYTVQLAYTPKK